MQLKFNASSVKQNWQSTWRIKIFRIQFVMTLIYIVVVASMIPFFFDFIEARSGSVLHDYIVNLIPSHDVSWEIFFFLYSGIFIGIVASLSQPKSILIILQTYCIVTALRVICILTFPLLPPDGYVPLREPVAQFFANHGRIISHDLFFSGHVSTILSVYFAMRKGQFKDIILFFSVMVGILVLVQHVHYTIDVVVAPVFTYLSYLLSKRITSGIS